MIQKPDLAHIPDLGPASTDDRKEGTGEPGPFGMMLLGRFLEKGNEVIGQFEAVQTDNCPKDGNEGSKNEQDVTGTTKDAFQECFLEDGRWWERALLWRRVGLLLLLLVGKEALFGLFCGWYVCPRSRVRALMVLGFSHCWFVVATLKKDKLGVKEE
jgi:hypothetical protein